MEETEEAIVVALVWGYMKPSSDEVLLGMMEDTGLT
jgi:hypothetical protein